MKSTVLTTNLLCPGISSKITRIDNKKVAGHSGVFYTQFRAKDHSCYGNGGAHGSSSTSDLA